MTDDIITQCECGSKRFRGYASTVVLFVNEDGTLHATYQENLGLESEIYCDECDLQYRHNDFKEIK